MKVLIATKNRGKAAEFGRMFQELGHEAVSLLEVAELPSVVEDGATFQENAVKKAVEYSRATGMVALADDSGLEVDYLHGQPGVHSARYAGPDATDEENNRRLLEALKGVPWEERGARFRCVLALASPDGRVVTAEGVCEGVITQEPQGEGGFGYDPIFFVPSLGRTMAQLSPQEKNSISHRGMALKRLRPLIPEFLGQGA